MKKALAWLRDEIGALALGALTLMGAAGLAHVLVVKPLEGRAAALERALADAGRRAPAEGVMRVALDTPAAKMAAFYRHFDRPEDRIEWLAKLYGYARAAGLELRSAEYRLDEPRRRLVRYQVSLPVTGTYAQVRAFVESALAGIPVLSLDQVSFRRKSASDTSIEAEVVLTLHLAQR